jgi:glycosyltransferase involved in cell wall biosynthesis
MRILINVAGMSATGPSQVAVSFINECLNYSDHQFYVFLSERIKKELLGKIYPSNIIFYDIHQHPIRSGIVDGIKVRKYLRDLEFLLKPDVVFSVFGPSYWRPIAPHLQGYAQPHYVYPESPYFKKIGFIVKLKWFLYSIIHMYAFKKCGDYFICETNDVAERLSKLHGILKKKIYVSSNTYGSAFVESENESSLLLPSRKMGEFRFLSLCSYMSHKNLDVINDLAEIIDVQDDYKSIVFVLTISDNDYIKKFSSLAKKYILNLGRIPVDKCPQIYRECDAVFLPTLLECFSANYPEAMVMKKPIITSDLSFARDVCGTAALYFNPLNSVDIVEKMSLLINDSSVREELIANGLMRLSVFDGPKKRAQKYLDVCCDIISKSHGAKK